MDHHTQTPLGAPSTPTSRMIDALGDPDRLFTRDQLIHMISLALGGPDELLAYEAGRLAGYRERVDEENAAHPAAPIFSFGEWQSAAERQAYRARLAADRTQHYAGGPVAVWRSERADHVPPAGISVRVVRSGAGWVWRDA